ncbi:MAG TPA: hypothetical protein VFA07_08525 [Chthonomonadaceae bacterium]|nr:hypothetical protein [Chthonomonadaceae bacterium]
MNSQITPRTAALVICVAAVIIVCIEARALWARDNPPPHVLTAAECTSCHSDPASLRLMKWKEGNLHVFFHGPNVTHLKLDLDSSNPAGSDWSHKSGWAHK